MNKQVLSIMYYVLWKIPAKALFLFSILFIILFAFFILQFPANAQTSGKSDYQCVYSEGPSQCFTGVCEDPTKCGFNVGCKYQPGLTTPIDCQQTSSESSTNNLVSCKDNPVDPPKTPSSVNFKYEWRANCSDGYECKNNDDCAENTSDPAVNPKTSNWCYKFSNGSKCLKLAAKRSVLSVSKKRVKNLDNYLKRLEKHQKINNSTNSAVLKYNSSLSKTKEMIRNSLEKGRNCLNEKDQKKRDRCKGELKKNHGLAKAAYRLVKYYSILSGRSNTCVEADMGMKPRITGTSMDKHAQMRRVFFCSGKDNKVDKLNIKFRVKSKDGKKLVRVKENLSLDPQKLPNADQVSKAEKLVGF